MSCACAVSKISSLYIFFVTKAFYFPTGSTFLAQQNAAELHSLAEVPTVSLATTVGVKRTDPVKNISLFRCITFPLVAVCHVIRF
jgi:hypothetical protein